MPVFDQIDVLLPVVLDVRGVQRLARPGGDRPLQAGQAIALPRNDVDDHLHVPGVQVVEHFLGIALEHARIEVERRLPRVPARRREAGAQVDDRVQRDFLFAERVNDVEQQRLAGQILVHELSMRLHVAQRPLGRHDGRPADDGDVLHELGRLVGVEDEQVVGAGHDALDRRPALKLSGEVPASARRASARLLASPRGRRGGRLPRAEHAAIGVAQVHLAPGRGDEQAPALRADHQGDWISRAVGVGLPTRPHVLESAAAVKLDRERAKVSPRQRPAFAHAQAPAGRRC